VLQFAKDFSDNNTGLKNYTTFSQQFGNPIKQLRTTDINLYVQDTWKLSRKVTLGYGLRYERAGCRNRPSPTRIGRRPARFPSRTRTSRRASASSYSIDDRTVIRAGYGMFYWRIHGNLLDTLFLGNGKYQTAISAGPSVVGTPVFPNILGASGANLPGGTISLQSPIRRASALLTRSRAHWPWSISSRAISRSPPAISGAAASGSSPSAI